MSSRGKIEKSENLKHADRILAQVRKIWPKQWAGRLKCWSNGREQGYWLQATIIDDKRYGRAACVFSEGRSCDGALVVIGPPDEFDVQTNQPSDALWEDHKNSRRYFYDTPNITDMWSPEFRGRGDKKAAKWIVKRFREILAEDTKKRNEIRRANEAKKVKAS
jgi:hypothetical protein